ncbi:MAG: tetratricopeptide repeat protein [Verrucomicrobiales bacterium]|nr:tetratricopeptide repeat protein [Verrucomicrobiales bacterium]
MPPTLVTTVVVLLGGAGCHLLAQDVPAARPPALLQAKPSESVSGSAERFLNSEKAAAPKEQKLAGDTSAAEPRDLHAAGWVQLGDRLMQKARESMESGLYERARSAYHKALDQDAKNEDALVGLAWVNNTQHVFDEGRSWAEKALATNPKLSRAHALLGDAAVELGDYEEALDHYQKALDIRPDLSSYSRSAHLVWLMGDARKGRLLMEKAIKAGGPYAENSAWCRAELARMLWQDGALLPAEQQAELALKQAPKNANVLATLARIKTANKQYDQAIELYQRAIEIIPTHDAFVALGDLFALSHRPEEAMKQYNRVVDLHVSGAAHSHGSVGQLHSHGNAQLARFYADHDRNLDDALREARLAYRDYKNVYVADTLAWCYYKKGHYEEAGKTIRKALRLNTPDPSILFHAGMIHSKLGDRGTAQKYLYRALSLNPQFHPLDSAIAAETLKKLGERPTQDTQWNHVKP